jgi:hypothetical protein
MRLISFAYRSSCDRVAISWILSATKTIALDTIFAWLVLVALI